MSGIIFSEGSGLNNSIYGKSQEPIKLFLEKRAEAYEAKSVLPEVFNMGTSSHFAEKYTSMTAMDGFMPVGENGAYPVDNAQEGYAKIFEHMTWKDSFALSREIIDDAKLMDLKSKPQGFISGYYRTREKFGAALLGNAIVGNATAAFKGRKFDCKSADGSNLFATNHPSKVKGGTQSNLFSNAFSADALAAAEERMQNFKGDNGELLDVVPTTIVIPNLYALKRDVFAVLGADKEPETANNGANFLVGRYNVIVWNYLNEFITSGTAPWIIMDKQYNEDYGSAVWLDRVKLEVRSELAENDANVWKGYARFTAGFNDWRGFAVGGVSGGTNILA